MKTLTLRTMVFIALLTLFRTVGWAQQSAAGAGEVTQKAEQLFQQEEYQQALTLYAQLLAVNPENPEYNYKFGVSTLYADRKNRRRAVRYLTIAEQKNYSDPKLAYYLGLAYYFNNKFPEAVKYFNSYLSAGNLQPEERNAVLEKVNASINGTNMRHDGSIAGIDAVQTFGRDNFYKGYRADDFDGVLIVKPDYFITPAEKQKGETSLVFISDPRDELYYSGYENGSAQRDLFRVVLDEKGDWGKPEKLPSFINTPEDEDYPVAVDNGNTIYFCSRGLNSIGGYDIFKVERDPVTGEYSKPENMGVGINSPFDDILYIPGRDGDVAYFASDRDNKEGEISIMKVRLSGGQEPDITPALAHTENAKPSTAVRPQSGRQDKEVAMNAAGNNASGKTMTQQLSPSEKAVMLKEAHTQMTRYADTAYRLVAQTKQLIRNLTNQRDQANLVTQRKEEAVKNLEVQLGDIMAAVRQAKTETELEKLLENARTIQSEIYQYRQRASRADMIARNLGKQIKIKNEELDRIKAGAGMVQSNAVAAKIEETRMAFLNLRNTFNLGDTLTDYTDALVAVNTDALTFPVPQSEFAFIDQARNEFIAGQTAIAAKSSKSVDADVPIVVVDNRTLFNEQQKPPPEKAEVHLYPVAETIALQETEVTDYPDELEIDFRIDAVDPLPVAEAIAWQDTETTWPEEDGLLEVNRTIDIDVYPVTEQVLVAFSDEDLMPDDQPVIDFSVDRIDPAPMATPVQAEFALVLPEDEPLELKSHIDVIPLVQAEPVEMVFNDVMPDAEDEPEISDIETITPVPVVAHVEDSGTDVMTLPEEEDPGITISPAKVYPVAEQIAWNEQDLPMLPEEDELEISHDFINRVSVTPVTPVIASFDATDLMPDDQLEIELSADLPEVVPVVAPVVFNGLAEADIEIDDELEIVIPEEQTKNISVAVAAEPLPMPYLAEVLPEDEELLITDSVDEQLARDRKSEALAILEGIREVSFDEYSYGLIETTDLYKDAGIEVASEDPEITVAVNEPETTSVDIMPVAQPVALVSEDESETLPQENDIEVLFGTDFESQSGTESLLASAGTGFTSMTESLNIANEEEMSRMEVAYLRESISVVSEIETSRSDIEMLRLALTDPAQLEYEELLYAASLTNDYEDKMAIYRQAFIHFNRDWRAFNNAAVAAMGQHQFDLAEVLLYQAHLITENNGNIYNNLGILASFREQYTLAANWFRKAIKLGVDAGYNLELIGSVEQQNAGKPGDMMKSSVGRTRYFELSNQLADFKKAQ